MQKHLTAAFVESVKVKNRTEFWDMKLSGFGLRVSESGSKTWCAIYRFQGQPRRYTIGTYPAIGLADARQAAQRALRDAQLGTDPAAQKKATRVAGRFGELAAQYLEAHAKVHKRSWREDERMIASDLLSWHNRPVKGITRKDVSAVVDGIVKRGSSIAANRVLALVSKIFNFAIGRGEAEINPAFKFPKPGKETKRERVLADDEIRKLWKALDDKPKKVAAYVKLCLLTGQRAREVLRMAVAEVDFETGIWTVPGARAKNKGEHVVPLSPTAMNMIQGLKNGTPYLFPMNRVKPAPMNTFRTWIDELRDELQFEPDWTCHDLRRTAATGMARLPEPKVGRFTVDRILNHSDPGVGAIYDRYDYLEEKRDALTRWDARLAEIVA